MINGKKLELLKILYQELIDIIIFPTYGHGYCNTAYQYLKDKKVDEYFDKVKEYTYKYAKHEYYHAY